MYDQNILTNRERRKNVAFLTDAWRHSSRPAAYTPLLDTDLPSMPLQLLFFHELCYQALATQPAPEAVVCPDWRRYLEAGTIDAIWRDTFSLRDFALDPPVLRTESQRAIITFTRLALTCHTWSRLLPTPPDPYLNPDLIYAVSGGAIKTKAFAVVSDMLRADLWGGPDLETYAMVPSVRVRKRAIRSGLIDLPENADTFADLKAVSRAIHAVTRLGEGPQTSDYLEQAHRTAGIRCEICNASRMASCPMPHCRYRRDHVTV